MKLLAATLLIILSAACPPTLAGSSEQNLFDKIITASRTYDISAISENEYDQLVEYISEGRTRWIDLYPTLSQHPFLGITSLQEGLNISMAYALPINPSEVLKFVNNKNVNFICGMPFIEPTQQEIEHYYSKTKSALDHLVSPNAWGEKCLYTLTHVMKK